VSEEGAGGRGIEPVAGRHGGAGLVPAVAFGDDRAPKELRRPGIAGTGLAVVDRREVEDRGRERVEGLGGHPACAGGVGVGSGLTSSDDGCRNSVADLEERLLLEALWPELVEETGRGQGRWRDPLDRRRKDDDADVPGSDVDPVKKAGLVWGTPV
jgi:hypothetical protein